MPRPIKFRAWMTENKYMATQGEPDIATLASFAHHYLWDTDRLKSGEMVLMQFTGLLDKNGKEIYEGDILLYKKTISAVGYVDKKGEFITKKRATPKEELHYWVVAFSPKGQWIASRKEIAQSLASATISHEVIGNVYENPELLVPLT